MKSRGPSYRPLHTHTDIGNKTGSCCVNRQNWIDDGDSGSDGDVDDDDNDGDSGSDVDVDDDDNDGDDGDDVRLYTALLSALDGQTIDWSDTDY